LVEPRRIPKPIWYIGLTSLFADISSEMVFGVLPTFMAIVLGLSMVDIGGIEGAAATTTSLLMVASGWFSDRAGRRKPIAILGYTLSAICKPFFAFATSFVDVFAVRVVDRIGKGTRTAPKDALIADFARQADLGRAYGLTRSMDTVGAIVGPIVALALALVLLPNSYYHTVFLLSIVPGLLATIPLGYGVKEQQIKRNLVTKRESTATQLGTRFKIYAAIVLLFSFANFSYAFFLLRATSLGVSPSFTVGLYLVFNVTYAAAAYPFGLLGDRLSKYWIIVVGYCAFGLMSLGFAAAPSATWMIPLFLAYGVAYAIVDTLQRAVVPELVSSENRGTAFGILHTSIGVAALPAGLIAGALWQFYSPSSPFLLSAVVSFVAGILLAVLLKYRGS
jgi:MFS family permease